MKVSELCFCILIYPQLCLAVQVVDLIYHKISSDGICFQRANATDQIGCSSRAGGNVGVMFLLKNESDLAALLNDGAHAPYIVAMHLNMFNFQTLNKLNGSELVDGVILLNKNGLSPEKAVSYDSSCPNEFSDFYFFLKSAEYSRCASNEWNPTGEALTFYLWKFPIFVVRNESEVDFIVEQCIEKWNLPSSGNQFPDYPLCSARLDAWMYSNTRSKTCYDRSLLLKNPMKPMIYCDPINGNNIMSIINPKAANDDLEANSVILVTARLDIATLFNDTPFGADSVTGGLVTLLLTSSALKEHRALMNKKTVIFVAFDGESLDYMGSSRMAYDMTDGSFPQVWNDFDLKKITWRHIDFVIDLTQVASVLTNKVYLHSDVIGRQENTTLLNKLKTIHAKLSSATPNVDLLLTAETSPNLPLPPSSIHSFLTYSKHLPALAYADFENKFLNQYYNTEYDDLAKLNGTIDQVSQRLSDLATGIAKTVFEYASDDLSSLSGISASVDAAKELLTCFGENRNCSFFGAWISSEKTQPVPYYLGPVAPGSVHLAGRLTYYLFAHLSGIVVNRTKEECVASNESGNVINFIYFNSTCVRTPTYVYPVRSPAFELNDYSGRYPTWTESRWSKDELVLFLVPDPAEEAATLSIGIIVFFLSFLTVYFLNRNARILFRLTPMEIRSEMGPATATAPGDLDQQAVDT